MLIDVNIKNFGLIHNVEINLNSGLCIITGASGSGKSVFIESIAFALGHSSGKKHSSDRPLEVSLSFELDPCKELLEWFDENSVEWENTCTIRRVIQPGKNAKSFVNGSVISLTNLKKLSPKLITLHGQHSNLQLLDSNYQHQCLDLYAQTSDLAQEVNLAYQKLQKLEKEFNEWENSKEIRSEQLNWLEYQIQELQKIAPKENECINLEAERKRLSLVGECADICHRISSQLAPIISRPYRAELEKLCTHFPELKNCYELLESIEVQAQECDYELNRTIPSLNYDVNRQQEVESRLSELYQLSRKHKCEPNDLNETLDFLNKKFNNLIENHENSELKTQIAQQKDHYQALTNQLSKKRKASSVKLENIINQSLHKIGLNEGKFTIKSTPILTPNPKGNESTSFWIQTNTGQSSHPIQSISGGEMSRLHLLLQSILPSSLPKCVIFDEIDVGISGSIAAIIGELLYEIADQYQALCITHLAQVACQGDQHLNVLKNQDKSKTTMQISSLSHDERVEVIAGLLSARDITDATRTQARHLLKACSKNQEVNSDAQT